MNRVPWLCFQVLVSRLGPLYSREFVLWHIHTILVHELMRSKVGWKMFLVHAFDGFIGKDTFFAQKQDGVSRKCIGFKMTGKSAPPRERYLIFSGDESGREIGEVTSGTQSPSLGCGIGLGYVESAYAKAGTTIEIEIRNRRFPAEVVKRPIFRKPD